MEVLSIVKCWTREQLTQEVMRSIQKETGIPARSVETMFWHYDILSIMAQTEWLVFKGGTCVQSYLGSGYQRASMDLDFNSTIENPNSIKDKISHLNDLIDEREAHVTIQGIDFGNIEFTRDDIHSGTLNFRRRMPSRFSELERVNDDLVQAKSIKIQINYKNAWLPAISPRLMEPNFFILDRMEPIKRIQIRHSSKEDLIADKILAICNVAGFGRERFKDLYDIGTLLTCDHDSKLVLKKLDLVAKRAKVESDSFVQGAIETISDFGSKTIEARGFASMIGKAGRDHIDDWEDFCLSTAERLKKFISFHEG